MKNILRKNFIVSLVALGISAVLLCGAVYAWFFTQTKPSGDMDLDVSGSNLEGTLYLGKDFNRDGNLDYALDPEGNENPYVEYAPVSGLLPTQVITVKLALRARSGIQPANLSVRFSDGIAASAGDTLTWFDLVELSAECDGAAFMLDKDAASKMYFNRTDFSVPDTGLEFVFRFQVKATDAGAQFDWSNVYQALFKINFTVTPK